MTIKYDVPPHLRKYLNDFPEKELCKVLTTMLELAIRNDLLNFPDTFLERSVKEIRDTVRELYTLNSLTMKTTETLLHEISTKISNLNKTAVTTPATHAMQVEEVRLVESDAEISSEISTEDFLDMIGGL